MTARSVVSGSAWAISIGALFLFDSMFVDPPFDQRLSVASVVVLAATLGALLTHFPRAHGGEQAGPSNDG